MLKLRSPAKVNLFLRVLAKRLDGYHELASLFQAVGLYDTLQVEVGSADSLTCSDPALPTDASNLVAKAVDLFRRKTGIKTPFKIHLDKQIPLEAGLGGGSSNAATALWAVNALSGSPATVEQLKAWSAEIGSDVTFFLSKGTAFCTGRGEIIEELHALPQAHLWILKPPYGLSTPAVYKALDLSKVSEEDPRALLKSFQSGSPQYVNDLESSAFKLVPELAHLKDALKQHDKDVLMSGSGSSFFVVGGKGLPMLPKGFFQASAPFVNRPDGQWY